MISILSGYIFKRFMSIFLFCLLGIVIIFIVVDMIENLDRFIDNDVPWSITTLYYLYFVPYIIIIILPVATLMTTVFSIGFMARHNEIVALKALGYSFYRILCILLIVGLLLSGGSFLLAETVAIHTNREIDNITNEYLRKRSRSNEFIRDVIMQDPPDKIVTIETYNFKRQIAYNVKIEKYKEGILVSKIDSRLMKWDGSRWIIYNGYERTFEKDEEIAEPITAKREIDLNLTPHQLHLSQIDPEQMSITELLWFVDRVRRSGGEVYKWVTQLNLRFSYPLSNVIIIMFSIPLVYNRRKKSLVVGFGISLAICFVYFGLVRIGQTMGEKGELNPFLGAWIGNFIMGAGGVMNLIKIRK
ncbi:MAG: LptF/LptG family permease [bacterium]